MPFFGAATGPTTGHLVRGQNYGGSGKSAAGGASPPVANPVAWWDATQIPAQADNTALSTWPDKSGNGYDLTQTGTNRPEYRISGLNSKPAVQFAQSAKQAMDSGSFVLAQPLTVMAVAQQTSNASVDQAIWMGSSSIPYLLANGSLGEWEIYAATLQRPSAYDLNAHMLLVVLDGASSSFVVDGTTTAISPGTYGFPASLAVGGTTSSPPTYGWTGIIAEVGIWGSAFTPTQVATCRTYSQNKWGTP